MRTGSPTTTSDELRATDPVSHHDHPNWERGYWAVTRHADVQRVSRDSDDLPQLAASVPRGGRSTRATTSGSAALLISLDAPEHVKLRKLINRGFTPRRVADLTDRIQARVDALLDALMGGNECDLVTDIALWLPLHVIADLVGVPEEDRAPGLRVDRADLRLRRVDLVRGATARPCSTCTPTPTGCARQRRAEPRDDLISVLLDAEVDGERLTQTADRPVLHAAAERGQRDDPQPHHVRHRWRSLEHPRQLERLRDDLSLLPVAIEELLRYVTPGDAVHPPRGRSTPRSVGRRSPAGDRLLHGVLVGEPRRGRLRPDPTIST